MARDGADDADVAECVMRGLERDIRMDGGVPAFPSAVDLVILASSGGANNQQLLAAADEIRLSFVDSPLTRHIVSAAEKLSLSAALDGHGLSREQAERMLLAEVAGSRCCDGMIGYITRNRTNDINDGQAIVESIKSKLMQTAAGQDLAVRMRNCSPKGLPSRPAKIAPVKHSAESLNNEEI